MASSQSSSKKKRWKRRTKPYNTPKPEELEMLVGRWKLSSIHYEPYDVSDIDELDNLENGNRGFKLPECEGVEVSFDDQCDLTWHLPRTMEPIPLFLTTSFGIDKDTIDMIGGEDGKTFRFVVDPIVEQEQLVLKTLISNALDDDDDGEEGEMVITISKVSTTSEIKVDKFSLKDALVDGFFCDLTLRSSDGATFQVHRVVLSASSCKMSYRDFEIMASRLKAPHLRVILEFLYTDSLPSQLNLPLAKELSAVIASNPKLSHLAKLCQAFINSNNLKQRMMNLVDDLQALLEHAKHMIDNIEVSNPAKITYAIKQLGREAVAGVAKLGMLCELYTRNKKDMTKEEKHEILEYVRGRVVVFIDLLSELIESAATKYNVLTDEQKSETAVYIIPEVERVWDLINGTAKEAEEAMLDKVKSLNNKSMRRRLKKQDLKMAILLQFITKGREFKRLQKIGKEFQDFVLHSHKKREEFREWSESEKAEKIMRVVEGLEGEGMSQTEQLADLKKDILIDNALDWKKFKLLVAIICNYVSWGLRKVQGFKSPLRPAILRGCKFVQKPEVNDALTYFDILNEEDLAQLRDDDQEDVTPLPISKQPGLRAVLTSADSQLAQGCLKLLSSLDYNDMKFVVMPFTPPNGTTEPSAEARTGSTDGGVVIMAHRVIVAARCEYFKRALQCGMKEDIDRCIVIQDCEESVFRTFLTYLYGGTLDTSSMSVDDIIELLAVADRYETTSLRGMCESLLVEKVTDSNVFALLQVADHYSARRLRESTLQHILTYPELMMTEIDGFYGLPTELRDEIRSITNSANPQLAVRHTAASNTAGIPKTQELLDVRNHSSSTSSCSSSTSSNSSASGPPVVSSFQADVERSLDSFGASLSKDHGSPESVAFQNALEELRGVVGDEATDEVLKEYLLAADMDVNRALNFYFS